MDSFYAKAEESTDFKTPLDGLHQPPTDSSSTSSTMMTTAPPPAHRSKNDGVVPDFIQKLFNMLESTDETSCYHWGRQGTAFVIDDTNEFAKTVLPRRFKHSNFSSFVRQLNKYDFHKIRFTDNQSSSSSSSSTVQQQAWEFQHPLFRRDKKHLLAQIHRKGNNHSAVKKNQRSSINKKASPSASSPPLDNTTASANPSDALVELHNLQVSLQAQIDKLSSVQQTMASTLGRLTTTDTVLLNELQDLKRKMDEKDSILSTILDLPAAKKQQASSSLNPNQQDHHHISSLYLSSPLQHDPTLSATTTPPPLPPVAGTSTATTPMPTNELVRSPLHPPPYQPASATSVPTSPTTSAQPVVPSTGTGTETTTTTTTTHTPPPTTTTTTSTTCHPWRHRPKVLVVEDNVMYRRISMRCLERLGCDFDMACDGLEAVAFMKQHKYDLILMDISIPKLDGMAATRKLRQYDQHTPVVSMTASYSDLDIQNYVGSGMSDLLPKPFDQHKLYDILKQHCAHLI